MKHCHFTILYNEIDFLRLKMPFLYEHFDQLIFYDLLVFGNERKFSNDGSHEFIKNYPDPENKITLIEETDLSGITPLGAGNEIKCKMFSYGSKFVRDDMDVFWCTDMDEFFKEELISEVESVFKRSVNSIGTKFYNFYKTTEFLLTNNKELCVNPTPNSSVRIIRHQKGNKYGHCDGAKYRPINLTTKNALYHLSWIGEKRVREKFSYYKDNPVTGFVSVKYIKEWEEFSEAKFNVLNKKGFYGNPFVGPGRFDRTQVAKCPFDLFEELPYLNKQYFQKLIGQLPVFEEQTDNIQTIIDQKKDLEQPEKPKQIIEPSNINNKTILFLGRKSRNKNTGIFFSAHMIVESLKNVGFNVIFIDSSDEVSYLTNKYSVDLIWIYDDNFFNLSDIIRIRNLYGKKIPILINSAYDGQDNQTNKIIHDIAALNSNGYNNVYYGVFSKEIENYNCFDRYKDKIIFIPKTIKKISGSIKNYSERNGICLGDFNKFMNSKLTNNLDVYEVIYQLKQSFPDIELYAFKHHNYDNHPLNPYKVNVVNNTKQKQFIENNIKIVDFKEDLIQWISRFRIYVSLINRETFSMIPTEVQALGTIVMYRDMPQSLNYYLWNSGYLWENTDDLKHVIKTVYYNEDIWNELSKLSILNYDKNYYMNTKYFLKFQVDKLMIRNDKCNS